MQLYLFTLALEQHERARQLAADQHRPRRHEPRRSVARTAAAGSR
jgi:hypothetical protein